MYRLAPAARHVPLSTRRVPLSTRRVPLSTRHISVPTKWGGEGNLMGNAVQGSRPAGGARRFSLTPHTRAHEKETRAIFSNVERESRTDANYENQAFSEILKITI